MSRSWAAVVAASIVVGVGCARYVPVDGVEFTREEKVVLTLDDGATITGRIDVGEHVAYETKENRRQAVVEVFDDTQIVLSDLVTLAENGSKRFERERINHFRLSVDETDDQERLVIGRDRVRSVQHVVTDRPRTVRQILFWCTGAGVALLAARDRNF